MSEFRILGDDFTPEVITEKLEIFPSKVWKKGEKIEGSNKVRDYSCWCLSTGYDESYDINEQLNKLLTILIPKKMKLIELKELLSLDYKIDIVINIESNEKPAIYLEKKSYNFLMI